MNKLIDVWYLRKSEENFKFLLNEGYSSTSHKPDMFNTCGCYYEVTDETFEFQVIENDKLNLSNQFYNIYIDEVINITSSVLGPNWNVDA